MSDANFPAPKRSSVVRSATVTKDPRQIIGPSETRVALIITPPRNTQYAVTLSTEPDVVEGAGLMLTMGYAIELTIERHGDAVVRPWYAVVSGGSTPDPTVDIGYLEVST